MAANGKGNGKKAGARAPESARDKSGAAPNGKAKGAAAARAPDEAAKAPAAEAAAKEDAPAAKSEPAAPETEPAAPPPAAPAPAHHGAAWAEPIDRFEKRWTWLESRLLTFVLVSQILSLVAWVFLKGLSESVTGTGGVVFRALSLAIGVGLGAWFGLRGQPEDRRRNLTLAGVAVGIGIVVLWSRAAASAEAQKLTTSTALALDHATAGYFDNIKGWLQEGSTLTLLGGPRGLATRLTLWLALLGGSLATGAGKHIHVDVVFRFLPRRARVPVLCANYLTAAVVCLAAVWGFVDSIAINAYGSKDDDRAGAKVANTLHHVENHVFLTRKQIGLDLRSLPHVLAGERYDQWMTAARWNEWVDGAGFEDHYDPAQVKNLRIQDGTHPPFVVAPDGESTRGALAHTLALVFPFGLLAIGLRFLLRILLTVSGHYSADPDEAHKEEIGVGNKPAEGGA